MEDLGTGEYAGGFSAMAAGAYSVSVTFQGTHIAGSPFAAEARRPWPYTLHWHHSESLVSGWSNSCKQQCRPSSLLSLWQRQEQRESHVACTNWLPARTGCLCSSCSKLTQRHRWNPTGGRSRCRRSCQHSRRRGPGVGAQRAPGSVRGARRRPLRQLGCGAARGAWHARLQGRRHRQPGDALCMLTTLI